MSKSRNMLQNRSFLHKCVLHLHHQLLLLKLFLFKSSLEASEASFLFLSPLFFPDEAWQQKHKLISHWLSPSVSCSFQSAGIFKARLCTDLLNDPPALRFWICFWIYGVGSVPDKKLFGFWTRGRSRWQSVLPLRFGPEHSQPDPLRTVVPMCIQVL